VWGPNQETFSLNEAQDTSDTTLYSNWRLALYDYTNGNAYRLTLNMPPYCAANPRATTVIDSTTMSMALVVTAWVPSECTNGGSDAGEMMLAIPAQ
jgi:hypothetical protein